MIEIEAARSLRSPGNQGRALTGVDNSAGGLLAVVNPIGAVEGALHSERLIAETNEIRTLSVQDRISMFALFERYYEATDWTRFSVDLAAKDLVVLIRRSSGEIAGFSTLAIGRQATPQGQVNYIFSGDTVLDAAHWGNSILLRAWFQAAGALRARLNGPRLFWFCIVKGHRTYRILPNFFHRFVPMGGDAEDLVGIRDAIASARYGDNFDVKTGLVDFGHSLGHLRPEWADAEATAKHNDRAAFFLKANPRHVEGVELACLAELALANLKRYAARSFADGLAGS